MESFNGPGTLILLFLTTVIVFAVPLMVVFAMARRSTGNSAPAAQTPLTLDPVAATDAEVLEHLQNKRKINAIKRYRELTGVGLKEAKDAIDYLERNPDAMIEKRTSRLSAESTAGNPFDAGIREMIKQHKSDEAIRVYQDFTGASPSEAAVEIERLTWEIEEQEKRSTGGSI